MTHRKTTQEAPAEPRPVGRPRRPRWPELPKRYQRPEKLTGIDAEVYRVLSTRGRITPERDSR